MPSGRFFRFTQEGKSLSGGNGKPEPFPDGRGYVRLTISDSGMGMSDEVIAHLFEPFFTTKEEGKGTGLGLATVFGAVMGAGGFIEVESALGAGTQFRLYFPLVEEDANSLLLSGSTKFDILRQYRGNTETVLVIEDEPEVRDFISQVLQAMNYRVIAAEDGSTGLNYLRTQGESISVVLLDLVMPGISGIDLAKTIRGERPDLPVLSMSGNNEKPTHSAGVQTHLEKPFTAESLLQAVKFGLSGILP
jgi:two-component system, cell cycle sensor histidine kinase and response regulator CckA